jgi:hypothetical protein
MKLYPAGKLRIQGLLRQFFPGADHLLPATIRAGPNGKRCSPIALPRKGPVPHGLKEIEETAGPHMFWIPGDFGILGDYFVLGLGSSDEPGVQGVVKERGIAAPAERIFMFVGFRAEKAAFGPQILDDFGIRVFHEKASAKGEFPGESSGPIHRLEQWEILPAAKVIVLLTEGRSDVDDAGPLLHGYELSGYYSIRA